jgi:hypothetical protein
VPNSFNVSITREAQRSHVFRESSDNLGHEKGQGLVKMHRPTKGCSNGKAVGNTRPTALPSFPIRAMETAKRKLS